MAQGQLAPPNRIRVATPRDAPEIASVHTRAWRTAYKELLPESVLSNLSVARRSESWRQALLDTAPAEQTFVLESAGRLAGFASVGPSRDPDAIDVGELRALYLNPDLWGKGLGESSKSTPWPQHAGGCRGLLPR